jgi:hypothetical protein
MAKITARELRKYLESRPHADLVNDILSFSSQYDGIKEYYSTRMGQGFSDELLDKYKAIIRKEFRLTRNDSLPRLSIARKAINDYKKVSRNLIGLIDLMLFYVESGVVFTNEFGDLYEAFYNSVESVYEGALKLIAVNGLQEQYRSRCRKIVSDTSGIGWGFHDNLSTLFEDAFES